MYIREYLRKEFHAWIFDLMSIKSGKMRCKISYRSSRNWETSRDVQIMSPLSNLVGVYLRATKKAIMKWVRFLNEKHGSAISIVLPKLKEPRTAIGWIPSDIEVIKIIHQSDIQINREWASRDGAIMRILFSGGVRLGKIARINLNDIREMESSFILRMGKLKRLKSSLTMQWMPLGIITVL